MSVIHGRDIKIYNSSGTAIIAGAKSCTIHKSSESIETSDPYNQTAKTYIAGRTAWSIDISHLVTTSTGGIPMVGNSYSVRVRYGSSTVLSGTAICTSSDMAATVGNLAQGSVKLLGTGELS